MDAHRLRAPSNDGALLADPPLSRAGARLIENLDRLTRWDHDFQGRRVGRLRPLARRQMLDKARDYLGRSGLDVPPLPDVAAPLVVTGHQPELFHPGVWVKNFVTAAIAQAQGGVGLNLIVDNDLAKPNAIRVPRVQNGAIRIQRVEYDDWGGEIPYEERVVRNEPLFATFGDRVREMLDGAVADPLSDDFWPRVLRHREGEKRLGLRFARRGANWRRRGTSGTLKSPSAPSARPRASSGSCRTSWHSSRGSRRCTTTPCRGIENGTASGVRITRSPRSAARATGARPPSGSGMPTRRGGAGSGSASSPGQWS